MIEKLTLNNNEKKIASFLLEVTASKTNSFKEK